MAVTSSCFGQQLRLALESRDEIGLVQCRLEVIKLKPSDRIAILNVETSWGQYFSSAASKMTGAAQRGSLWSLLDAVSDIRPPPVREFTAHFCDSELILQLKTSIRSELEECLAACRCIKNLGRVSRIRPFLEDCIEALVEVLESSEIAAVAAAALCNVACTSKGKEKAVGVGAIKKLLQALDEESAAERADDLLAALGVLTSGHKEGAEALMMTEQQSRPILKSLDLGCPVPAATALEVMYDLLIVLGVSNDLASTVSNERNLVREQLPSLVRHQDPSVRFSALKLCAALLEFTDFRANFTALGVEALKQSIALEPPLSAPNIAASERNKFEVCKISCVESCCFGPAGKRPPSRQELAEQLLNELLNS